MNQENDTIENLEEKLKATRFRRCFDCNHFNKEDYTCDGKRLWMPKMFRDDWYLFMTISHHPIGCKKMDERFVLSPKKRDFEICENCKHFRGGYDGRCYCCNSLGVHCGGHRWCGETREEVSSELFEKATFDLFRENECYYKNGGLLFPKENDK